MPDVETSTPDAKADAKADPAAPIPAEPLTEPVSEKRLELLKTVQEFAARGPGGFSVSPALPASPPVSEAAPVSEPAKRASPVSRSEVAPIRTTRAGIASTVRGSKGKAQRALAAPAPAQPDAPIPAATAPVSPAEDRALMESSALVTAARAAAELVAREFEQNTKISAEAEHARAELAREQAERRVEAIQASVRLSEVKMDLADARSETGDALQSLARERKFRIAAVIAAVGLTGVVFAWWLTAPGGGIERMRRQTADAVAAPAPAPIAPLQAAGLPSVRLVPDSRSETAPETGTGSKLAPGLAPGLEPGFQPGLEPGGNLSESRAAFTEGINRLTSALATAGRGEPQDVLVAARAFRDPAICPFVWSDGQIALIYSGKGMTLKSMAESLTRCAKVVEQLGRTPPR